MPYNLSSLDYTDGCAHPVAANTQIERGGLVALNAAGFAVPAGTVTAVAVLGRAWTAADNREGVDGAQSVTIDRGVFALSNSEGSPVKMAQVGKVVYAEDPGTIRSDNDSANDGSITGPVAGILIGFDVDTLPVVDTTFAVLIAALS